jgi:hypothetical protein
MNSPDRTPATRVPLNLVLALVAFAAGTAAAVIVVLLLVHALD